MFTGIVEATAEILRTENGSLVVRRPDIFTDVALGSSIAISGVCLTVCALNDTALSFDVVPETLRVTTLGSKAKGDHVNMERALAASGRFDGHMVQGHIEGLGQVQETSAVQDPKSNIFVLVVKLPKELITNIVQKGSVTLDGVSLTVASVEGDLVSVALIPHTLAKTTLGALKAGDTVNVETDILGRYVATLLKRSGTLPA